MRLLSAAALVLVTAACNGTDTAARDTAAADTLASPGATPGGAPGMAPAGGTAGDAIAEVRDRDGRMLGTLTVSDGAGGVTVSGRLTGLTPGQRAIHVHNVGQCSPPFDGAGPHWNPTSRQHGTQNPEGPHLGDLPNLTVASDGSVDVNVTTPGGTLRGENALLDGDGASVVIHQGPDDYRTDPSGNSGDRIACGVITPR